MIKHSCCAVQKPTIARVVLASSVSNTTKAAVAKTPNGASTQREHAIGVYRDTSFIQFTLSAVAISVALSLNIETWRIGCACCACVNRWPVIGGDANPLPGHASKAPAPLAHPCARGALGFSTRVPDAAAFSSRCAEPGPHLARTELEAAWVPTMRCTAARCIVPETREAV